MHNVKHILISRVDNIGDVILTLPLAGILKQYFPNVKITFLAREYVRSIVAHCAYVDAFYSWDALSAMSQSDAVEQIKSHAFDVVIHVLPKKQIGMLMRKAYVPYRIGPSSRFYYWLTCNKLVRFSRRKSELHEAQLNLNLLKPFNIALNDDLNYLHDRMGLRPADPLPAHLRSILQPNKFNLIVHPFSNGHAREWPISHFIALINQLPRDKIHVIISGSQKESEAIQNKMMTQCSDVTDISGRCDLHEFIQLIAHADGLIANSTGPLHLAAVFNIHALGLYPITKGIDPNRWAPIGKKAEFLTVDPNCNAPSCRDINDCVCMESITVEMVKNKVLGWSS